MPAISFAITKSPKKINRTQIIVGELIMAAWAIIPKLLYELHLIFVQG